MNAKISVLVFCVEVIIHLLLYNLHDGTFIECVLYKLHQVEKEKIPSNTSFNKHKLYYILVKQSSAPRIFNKHIKFTSSHC